MFQKVKNVVITLKCVQSEIHTRYDKHYFVLTNNELTSYKKKKSREVIDEICLPCAIHVHDVNNKKYVFELSSSTKKITLAADSKEEMSEWVKMINEISLKKNSWNEQKIDEKQDEKMRELKPTKNSFKEEGDSNEEERGTKNTIEIRLKRMLSNGTDSFGIQKPLSSWRSSLSLRGLTSATCGELPKSINSLLSFEYADSMETLTAGRALAMHNKSNLLMIGCKCNGKSESNPTKNQCGDTLQTFEWKTFQKKFVSINSLPISNRVICLDWQDNLLLVGTNRDQVLCYTTPAQSKHAIFDNANAPISFTYTPQRLISNPSGRVWTQSSRVNKVKLQRIANADSFLTIQNDYFYLWSIESPQAPLNFQRVCVSCVLYIFEETDNTAPLYGLEWQPKHSHVFVVGGASGSLKIVDLRDLSRQSSKTAVRFVSLCLNSTGICTYKYLKSHECFKMRTATLSEISRGTHSWNIGLRHVVTTRASKFGTLDMRMLLFEYCVSTPIPFTHCRLLLFFKKVGWSKSHAEMLVSGGTDCTLMLWNLRVDPHFLLYSQPVAGSVIGCEFSGVRPFQYFGLSNQGDLCAVQLHDEFIEPFVPHKSNPSEMEKRGIEKYMYLRNMKEMHANIQKVAQRHWDNQDFVDIFVCLRKRQSARRGGNGINLGIQTKREKKNALFEETLKNCSYHIPNDCTVTNEPDKSDLEEIEVIKMRLFVNKLLKNKDGKNLIVMQPKIFEHLQKRFDCFSADTLRHAIALLKSTGNELVALQWAIQLNPMFSRPNGNYKLFVPIAKLLLRPTIYDSRTHIEAIDKTHSNESTVKKKEFQNPMVVEEELKILYHLQQAAECKTNPFFKMVEAMEKIELEQFELAKQNSILSASHSPTTTTTTTTTTITTTCNVPKSRVTIFTDVQEREKFYTNSTQNARANLSPNYFTDTTHMTVPGKPVANVNNCELQPKSAPFLLSFTQKIYQMYLEALLQTGHIAKFFIIAIKLMNKLQGFDFANLIHEWITTTAFHQLLLYLDNSLKGTYKKPAPTNESKQNEKSKPKEGEKNKEEEMIKAQMEAVLALIELCTSLTDMPVFLQNVMPKYLKDFKKELKFSFNALVNRGNKSLVKEYITHLIEKITTMNWNKLLPVPYFHADIDQLCKELQQMQLILSE
ncbi:hypothetical protein RFI_13484 [Reticulomyxa filosa]|uniref:PH domain-containing protein n=1 Tax=Reticulomyxa filosa TaxID=46433 RepID=X6NCS0_RETFI|nr:hypothetical protein RFI_13484 [Reticulomyxa filosa]|eukprot:ETO23693.1 hypothetical protein RFI_13484 [Reticulomyxa filosa]